MMNNIKRKIRITMVCYSNFPLYIVHHCYSIRKLTMAQEFPKHMSFFKFESLALFINNVKLYTKKLLHTQTPSHSELQSGN